MNSLILELLLILMFSFKVQCSVWPNTKPKFTSSYLAPAVQILHVQTERLDDIRISTMSTTEATSTSSSTAPISSTTASISSTTASISSTTASISSTTASISSTSPVGNITCQTHKGSADGCKTSMAPTEASEAVNVMRPDLLAELNEELNQELPESFQSQSNLNVIVNATPSHSNQSGSDQLTDYLTHTTPEEETRLTTSSYEKETNSTSTNKEDEDNWNILVPMLALERLRDLLTADAKRQGLSKIQGYSEELLEKLSFSSLCTSRNQLRIVLIRMLKRGDAERKDGILMTKKIIEKLKDPESPLSLALKLVPSLKFTV